MLHEETSYKRRDSDRKGIKFDTTINLPTIIAFVMMLFAFIAQSNMLESRLTAMETKMEFVLKQVFKANIQ